MEKKMQTNLMNWAVIVANLSSIIIQVVLYSGWWNIIFIVLNTIVVVLYLTLVDVKGTWKTIVDFIDKIGTAFIVWLKT